MIKVNKLKSALKRGLVGDEEREFASLDSRRWSRQEWKGFWGDFRAQMVPQGMQGAQMLSVLPASFFSTPDWRSFAQEVRGIQEVVRWPLYHYKIYSAAGYTQRQFFDETEGSATQGRGDTNMKSIGALPGNEMQVVVGIRVIPMPALADETGAVTTASVALQQWSEVLIRNCWLEMIVSDKEYMVAGPLIMFPAGCGLGPLEPAMSAGVTTVFNYVQNGSPDNKAIFHMDPPIGILPTRAFKVLLRWQTALTVTTAGKLGVVLEGWKVRAVL